MSDAAAVEQPSSLEPKSIPAMTVTDGQNLNPKRLLRSVPPVLIEPKRKLIVLWSPKSACTTVYVWFSHLAGFGDEVKAHPGIPHQHRMKVYQRSARYLDALKSDTGDFHVLRVIRDPYTRAVSIFRHALTVPFADTVALAAGLDFHKGVSFRRFLDFVATRDMTAVNMHIRPQFHPYERYRKPDTVLNISKCDLFRALNALERQMSWPVTDFAAMTWLHEFERSRRQRPPSERFADENVDEVPLTRAVPARKTRFPEYGQLLTPAAKGLVREIYRQDFSAYADYL